MTLQLLKADITLLEVDAIVNAANTSLLGGSGVDGAIHRKGGKKILEACEAIRNKQGGCKIGEAVITTAGNLPAQFVIHTVGPVWSGNKTEKEIVLAHCYRNCLKLAEENNLKSIAFPNISTGIYGFPKDKAAEIAIELINNFKSNVIEEVIFVCYDEENYDIYNKLLVKVIGKESK